ncbi:unnamed protein product [Prorocentrum cordatum]|uniref:Protein-serine/threonine kinase n=1 Tax=Prorocentrum cordatum TaxID=2364126 RepID=A0ABN9RH25_9DINO|nr:unnamed protein product [Polarella glacialis]
MRAGALRRIKQYARRPIRPVTIQQLLSRSRGVSDSDHVEHAEWLREQLPVRLAHRLSDFMQLPYVVLLNARFHEMFRLNFQAFDSSKNAAPVHDAASSAEFAEVLHRLVRSTDDMVRTMQEGYGELQMLLGDLVELDSFIDRVFVTRIGNRLLAEHYVAVDEARARGGGHAGVVRQDCRPAEIAEALSRSLGDRFQERYGARPLVVVEGQTDTEFSFVPEHLDFVLQEVLKNAMRATVEAHIASGSRLPPVSVEIMKGSFDVTLKISDAGGGMRRDTLDRIWKYGYTSPRRTQRRRQC